VIIENEAPRTDMITSAASSECINPLESVDRAPSWTIKGTARTNSVPTISSTTEIMFIALDVESMGLILLTREGQAGVYSFHCCRTKTSKPTLASNLISGPPERFNHAGTTP
jgi:hypothetical protein